MVTDHDSNKLVIYGPSREPKQGQLIYRRIGIVDLNQPGQAELRHEGEK